MHVIKEPTELSFNKVGIKGKVFPTAELTMKTQYFLVETDHGHETAIIEHECDFIYYILAGTGFFEIDGTREDCAAGDLVVIQAGKKFTYKGAFKMIATSTPPWSEDQEESFAA